MFSVEIKADDLDESERLAIKKIRELVKDINSIANPPNKTVDLLGYNIGFYDVWFDFNYDSLKAETTLVCHRYHKPSKTVLTVRDRAIADENDTDQLVKLASLFYFIKNLEGFKAALEYKKESK
jgi:hypothetical protein